MPATALTHFREDLIRSTALVAHGDTLPRTTAAEAMLRSDILRSGWMFAVGALDAYFCDAYTDIVAAAIIAKSRQQNVDLPNFFLEIRFPVRAILEPYSQNENWRWRMAAREMMAKENVTRLATVQTLFNKFFRRSHRFFGDLLPTWILHANAKKRLFGITRVAFSGLTGQDRDTAVKSALAQMEDRFRDIFQRRHDCIHNCDRPRVSPQTLTLAGTVTKVIQDIEFLVLRCDEHIDSEFREFLLSIGCLNATITQAGY